MKKTVIIAVVLVLVTVFVIGCAFAASKLIEVATGFVWGNNSKINIVESYKQAKAIGVGNLEHELYESRKIGDIFVSSYLEGRNATRSSEGPPYSLSLGFYAKEKGMNFNITIVSANILIGNATRLDVINEFETLSVMCIGNRELNRANYGSVWISTGYFIAAKPLKDQSVSIQIVVKVRDSLNPDIVQQKQFDFDFVPVVAKVAERYI